MPLASSVTVTFSNGVGPVVLQLPSGHEFRETVQALHDPREVLERLEAGEALPGDRDRVLVLAWGGPPLEVSSRGHWTRPGGYQIIGYGSDAEGDALAIKVLKAWLGELEQADATFAVG